jgi:hypothetical protein
MKKRINAAALVFCFAALLMSCENTVLEDGEQYGFDPDYLAALEEAIVFSEAGLVAGTELVSPGAVVTKITFPEEDGPWEAALVKGAGDTDNRLFSIEAIDEDSCKLVITGTVSLEFGHYSVRIRIRNEEGVALRRVLEFDVTYTPPFFTQAPGMYPVVQMKDKQYLASMEYSDTNIPDIKDGSTGFIIKWPKRATATSYTVYVGKTDKFADARVLSGAHTDIGAGWMRAQMTAFPDEEANLPNNTRYWAWVKAANGSGETPQSPAATRKTSLPMQEYFYVNTADIPNTPKVPALHDCGGYGDYYRFTPTTVKYWFGTAGGYNYLGDVVYHETIDLGPDGENGPFPNKIKDGASCLGFPAGVFVIRYRDNRVPSALTSKDNTPGKMKRYSAVYYWGTGTVKPEGTVPASQVGRVESDIVNQWKNYAERVTYEEAVDLFTADNILNFLGLDPEPYYKQFPDYNTEQAPCYEPWPNEGVYTVGIGP